MGCRRRMLIAGATAGAASRGKRRMPCAQVTRSSKMVLKGCIGGGPQAEQQRCGQGRPVDAARGSSDSPDESQKEPSASQRRQGISRFGALTRARNRGALHIRIPFSVLSSSARFSSASASSGNKRLWTIQWSSGHLFEPASAPGTAGICNPFAV